MVAVPLQNKTVNLPNEMYHVRLTLIYETVTITHINVIKWFWFLFWKGIKKLIANVKLNVFKDLFFEKQIMNYENHTNCNSESIAKHSARVVWCVCVFMTIHCEGLICMDQLGYQGTDQRCYVEDKIKKTVRSRNY